MATPRIAKSLDKLRTQINAAHPNRSKASDGWIGDASHSARVSDHNPNAAGVVQAFDVTHDPVNGQDNNIMVAAIVKSKDSRVKYIIWRERIISGNDGPQPWVWREYDGTNPHDKHAHISVEDSPILYDNTSSWAIVLPKPPVVKKVQFELWDEGKKHSESLEVKAGAGELARLQTFFARVDAGLLHRLQDEGDVADVRLVRRVTQK